MKIANVIDISNMQIVPNYALSFDGVDDYGVLGANTGNFGNNNFKIKMRLKFDNKHDAVLTKSNGNSPTNDYGWLINTAFGHLNFACSSVAGAWGDVGTYSCRVDSSYIPLNEWLNIEILADRNMNDLEILINGSSVPLISYVGGLGQFNTVGDLSNTLNCIIGNENDLDQGYFDGMFDYIEFYENGNLVNEYKINEGSGTTLTDSAGSNDGTIIGATWQEVDY